MASKGYYSSLDSPQAQMSASGLLFWTQSRRGEKKKKTFFFFLYWRYRVRAKRERELDGKTQTKEEVECPVGYFTISLPPFCPKSDILKKKKEKYFEPCDWKNDVVRHQRRLLGSTWYCLRISATFLFYFNLFLKSVCSHFDTHTHTAVLLVTDSHRCTKI